MKPKTFTLCAKKLSVLCLASVSFGCQTPGVVVYGDPVTRTTSKGGSAVTTPKLVTINADIIGDIEVPGRLSIKTAKDAAGNFAYVETPVVVGTGTNAQTVITRQPMVAQIKTASVWDAWFSGGTKLVGSVGQWIATAIGLGAVAPVTGTAVNP